MISPFKVVFFFILISFSISPAASKTLTVTDAAVLNNTSSVLPDSSIISNDVTLNNRLLSKLQLKTSGNKKVTAFFLAIFLGHFGVHRLYLGTERLVPIAYVLTLGGGLGVLPAIDAIVILLSKDLEKLENNSRFFMWSEQ